MYLILDTETGGIDPAETSLLEVYLETADEETLEPGESLHLHTKPDGGVYHVTAQSLAINGINLIAHDKQAISYTQARANISDFLSRMTDNGVTPLTPMGWNVAFDIEGLKARILPARVWNRFVLHRRIDVCDVARSLRNWGVIKTAGSLKETAEALGFSTEGHHSAPFDVALTRQVYAELGRRVIALREGRP